MKYTLSINEHQEAIIEDLKGHFGHSFKGDVFVEALYILEFYRDAVKNKNVLAIVNENGLIIETLKFAKDK